MWYRRWQFVARGVGRRMQLAVTPQRWIAVGSCAGAVAGLLQGSSSTKAEDTDNSAAELYRPPSKPYPLWDDAWDSPPAAGGDDAGPCRHLLLVRHGQYDESSSVDSERGLTAIGWQQAELTGKRLAAMCAAPNGVQITRIHVSSMRRARETADAIARTLPASAIHMEPDPDLNEGIPVQPLPADLAGPVEDLRKDGARAERAFLRYFHRGSMSAAGDGAQQQHVCEVIVGHANILRYFTCRALQLPPECWLRFHTFNCSVTYIIVMPDGRVQARALGDVGHLPESLITFSGRAGWNWYGKPTKCLPAAADSQQVVVAAKDAA
eukprot:TRINITY_DN102190_c0_g1_i1.p1 TRINITY_DN102190_c0_g1~~TRINITY_DN102190_c0_g1_i1.p1  ORF type:complete len:323 (+),score=32.75 TRINITY_DN102190_c0_g1_i1:146-1114(+)